MFVVKNDQVPRADGARQDQGPHGVQQARVTNDQVGGHHAAAHEHGHNVEQGNRLLQRKILTAQGIGGGDRDPQVHQHTAGRVQQRVQEAPNHRLRLENLPVTVQGKADRGEYHLAAGHRHRVGERGDDDKVQRIGHNQQHERQQNEDDRIENHVGSRPFQMIYFHSSVSSLITTGCSRTAWM